MGRSYNSWRSGRWSDRCSSSTFSSRSNSMFHARSFLILSIFHAWTETSICSKRGSMICPYSCTCIIREFVFISSRTARSANGVNVEWIIISGCSLSSVECSTITTSHNVQARSFVCLKREFLGCSCALFIFSTENCIIIFIYTSLSQRKACKTMSAWSVLSSECRCWSNAKSCIWIGFLGYFF